MSDRIVKTRTEDNDDLARQAEDWWTWAQAEAKLKSEPPKAEARGPSYYHKGIQPTHYIVANNLGWHEGNVVKYITRWREKDGVRDLEKAKHYIELLIESEQRKWRV